MPGFALTAALLALPLVLAACASALTPIEQDGAEQVRRFVAQTAAVYERRPPRVMVGAAPDGVNQGGGYGRGQLFVTPRIAVSSYRDALVAHELGHWLLGHGDGGPGTSFGRAATLQEWEREQAPREMDANVKAVEILVRVKGWSEPSAVRHVFDWLYSAHRSGLRVQGHVSPCEEIADLLRRFPEARWSNSIPCQTGRP